MGMRDIANAQAERSVPHIDLTGRRRLLDLGGATGAYAIHFCRRNPDLEAVVFDLPTSKPFAERVIAEEGMADRVRFRRRLHCLDELPGGFDVAWLSQMLHGAGFEASVNIVRKAAQSLVPGGLLLIQEFILDDDRNGPEHSALFDLNMLIGTPDGQSYTRQELAGFLRDAGAVDIRRLPLHLPQGCGIMAGRSIARTDSGKRLAVLRKRLPPSTGPRRHRCGAFHRIPGSAVFPFRSQSILTPGFLTPLRPVFPLSCPSDSLQREGRPPAIFFTSSSSAWSHTRVMHDTVMHSHIVHRQHHLFKKEYIPYSSYTS